MKLLDLFSGIGGLSLGFERAGFQTVAFCEIDWRCRNVLAFHWPGIPVYLDARTMQSVEADVVAGGPPCQRTSVAAAIHGKRTGETLWPAMRSVLARSGASRAVVEQPPGNAAWEAQVQADLATDGFGVSRHVIAACDVGGVNTRRRVFLVADRDRERLSLTRQSIASSLDGFQGGAAAGNHWSADNARAVRVVDGVSTELDLIGRLEHEASNDPQALAKTQAAIRRVLLYVWEHQETAASSPDLYRKGLRDCVPEVPLSYSCGGWLLGRRLQENEGLRGVWEAFLAKPQQEAHDLQRSLLERARQEKRPKEMAADRAARIRQLGNSIVPQVAEIIGRAIMSAERETVQ